MIKKREVYINLSSFRPRKDIKGNFLCLNCNSSLENKPRAYKWCSKACIWSFMERTSHQVLRTRTLIESNNECKICGKKVYDSSEYVLDHIIPISLGGGEFDKTNVQILCISCNKVKTKKDLSIIKTKKQNSIYH